MALEADHLQMARFSEEADINYQKVILALRSVCCPRNEVYTNIMLPARLHSGRLRNLPVTSDLCEELLLAEDSDRDAKPSGLAEDSDRDAKPSGPLALLLEHQGHYTKAEEFFANLAQDYGSSLGSQHRLTLYCLDKKASLLCKRGAYEDAEELIRKNLKIRISTSGKTCLSVLLNSCTMASSLISRGYYGTAEKLLCDALEYSSSSYPGNVAWVQLLNCLATTSVRCQSAGFGSRFNTEYLAVKVVGESISLYGEKHPFTLNHMSDLADGLASRSQFAEAEAIGRFVLNATSQVLGSHHPQVLRSAQRLADYIRCQHRYNEAATSLKSTLELQKRKQGNWNPDTLTTMKSLGLVYILQGYLQNAEELLEQTYVGMKQVLGKEHPTSIWVSQLLIRLKAEQNTNLDSVEGTDHSDAIRTSPSGMHPGADYDFFSSALDDEVIKAARKGDTISLQTTLRENKVGTRVFERALHEAASNGQNEALKVLLKDYSVNSQDGLYGTPLQAACYFGEYDTVQFLLEHNADINVRGGVCGNALQAAVLGRQPRILELLLTRDLSSDIGKECLNSSLSTAILTKQNQLVPKLRHAGADVNCKDYLFGGPLQQASFFGQKEVMTILLKEGASTSLPGGIFECPLKAAIASGNRPCVLLLLDSGASIGQLYSKPASKMKELTAANEAFLKSVILEKMKASQLPLSRNSLEKSGLVPDTNNLTLSKAEETRGLQLQKGADVQLTSDTKPPNNLQTTSHRPGAKNLEVRYENTTSTSGTLDTETSSSRASNVSRCKQYLTEKSKNAKKGFKKRFQEPHRVNEKKVATR